MRELVCGEMCEQPL